MLLEADKIYQGTSQIYLGTGPGRPWCRYATVYHDHNSNLKISDCTIYGICCDSYTIICKDLRSRKYFKMKSFREFITFLV